MGLMAVAAQVNAQEATDDAASQKKTAAAPKLPEYPMMEITGTIYDAATGKPLSGVQVQPLGNANYAAMTKDDGTFTIKVPTFTTSLYLFTSQYASRFPSQVRVISLPTCSATSSTRCTPTVRSSEALPA